MTSHPRPPLPLSENVTLKEYFITIDSRDRDRSTWPSANNFQVKMEPESSFKGATVGRSFKNVKCIEVISVQFPNTNNVLDQMYLYLCFDEFDGIFEATNLTGTKAVAKLVPSSLIGDYVCVEFEKPIPKKVFFTKGVRLDRLTISFRTYNGTLFNFGTDTSPPSDFNPKLQCSITIRVIVQVPNTI